MKLTDLDAYSEFISGTASQQGVLADLTAKECQTIGDYLTPPINRYHRELEHLQLHGHNRPKARARMIYIIDRLTLLLTIAQKLHIGTETKDNTQQF
jgi:hypothetical protein